MAQVVQVAYDTAALNLYMVVRDATGQAYRADTGVFEAYSTANLTSTKYAIAMTEQGTASRFYTAAFPTAAAVVLGTYSVAIYVRLGANPAETDTLVTAGTIWWNGTAIEVPQSANIAAISIASGAGTLTTATGDSGTLTTGTNISGSYTDTFTDDNVYWITAPVASPVGGFTLRQQMTFNLVLGRIPVGIYIRGWFQGGASRLVDIYALNSQTGLYDKITNATTAMLNRTTELAYSFTLPRDYADSSGGVNNIVTLEFRSVSTTTTDRLRLDQVLITHVAETVPTTSTSPTVPDIVAGILAQAQLTPIDVRLADAVDHGGTPGSSTATLALQQLSLYNPSGNAVDSSSSGGWHIAGDDGVGNTVSIDICGGGQAIYAQNNTTNARSMVTFANYNGGTPDSSIPIINVNSVGTAGMSISVDTGDAMTLDGSDRGLFVQGNNEDAIFIHSTLAGKAGVHISASGNPGTGLLISGSGADHDITLAGDGVFWDNANFTPVSMRLADGTNHGGPPGSSTATLALASVNITNSGGDAVTISGDTGISIQANQDGINIQASGNGITVGAGQAGIYVQCFGGQALFLDASGAFGFSSIYAVGSGAPAVQLGDGSNGAEALLALAGTSNTDAAAIKAVGAGTGAAMQLGDASVGAIGLLVMGGLGDGGNAAGVSVTGAGSGSGMNVTGGSTGYALHLYAAGAQAAWIESVANSALALVNAASGPGDPVVFISGGYDGVLISTANDAIVTSAARYGLNMSSGNLDIVGSNGFSMPLDFVTLASFFNVDSGQTFGTSVPGSVVKETASSATVVGDVTLAASQPSYAPAKAGDAMTLTIAYDAAKTAADASTVAAAFTTLSTHGDSTWATATGFAVPGSLMGLADGAITDAKFTTPSDGTGQVTGILSMILWLYERFFGKVVHDKTAKTIKTFQADGTTTRTTQAATTVANVDTVDRAT